jgi:CheY-like chemotaxis protein
VIDLCRPPTTVCAESTSLVREMSQVEDQSQHFEEEKELHFAGKKLPENLSVLFVDDDPILRKLFSRMVKKAAPSWEIQQASNGEAALFLSDSETYDLFFIDMYMASVDTQLLGTQTVEALRSRGVKGRICGLSANDKEKEFLEAGANAFTFKPLPCETKALVRELYRILEQDLVT